MVVLFVIGLLIVAPLEARGNTKLKPPGVTQTATATNPGGNLEGKDLRIGTGGSALNADFITGTSAGMADSAHESFTPIGGSVPHVPDHARRGRPRRCRHRPLRDVDPRVHLGVHRRA